MARYDWITFLSDYGLRDSYVGVCHGVMARIAPHARVIDLSHAVGRQDVRQGAMVLAQSVAYLPDAVHLAVVDPGVGTRRGQVALRAGGRMLVGPDNGLLVWAAEELGGIERAHALASPDYQLSPVSKTFHGRDVFAPAAAHLAAGVDPAALGPELDPAALVRLRRPTATLDGDRLVAEVVAVDHFGNLLLSFGHAELERAGLGLGDAVEIRVGERSFGAAVGETFAAVPAGALVVHEDSSRRIAISLNRGRAAERLGVGAGDAVVLARSGG
ncbi:MAG TPA: SAM-dependent chlorinase/fluorinase [Actinomycetota bacterium]|jgi:S-adenosylmethionine hydrolase|nr:SAM-dependent chlorinase/fluorinase [Actinomycetota bacterium]